MALLTNLIHSRVAAPLRAIHGAEDAANAMGVDTARYKLQMFVLSARWRPWAACFLPHYNGGIGPSEASIMSPCAMWLSWPSAAWPICWGALIMGVLLNFFPCAVPSDLRRCGFWPDSPGHHAVCARRIATRGTGAAFAGAARLWGRTP